jgi:hypothetical protein
VDGQRHPAQDPCRAGDNIKGEQSLEGEGNMRRI